jgi:indolepyruvate ferredoxin oxidoreductase
MAAGKRFRGTSLDVFGRTPHRRQERALIGEYEQMVGEALALLRPETHALAVQLASLPEQIRGFDTVKDASIETARAEAERLLGALRDQQREPAA